MTKLEKAISKIINQCLRLQPNESLLILIDETNRDLGHLILKTALRVSENSILVESIKFKNSNNEPSPIIKSLMKQVNANIIATAISIDQTKAFQHARHHGARIISLSNLSLETIERCVNTDFPYIAEKSNRLADLFSIGKTITLTTPAGTDMKIPINRRQGIADTGLACHPGMFATMPAGAATISFEREKTEGIIIVDGSLGSLGLIKTPIELKIKQGHITKILGEAEAAQLRRKLKSQGKNARYIVEIGIGTNPKAKLTGKSSEDEKASGHVYFKIGNNSTEDDHDNKNFPVYLVLKKATINIDRRPILIDGRLMI